MSLANVPSSSLALGTSATGVLPHTFAHATLSVHKVEHVELPEMNEELRSQEQERSVPEQDVSQANKSESSKVTFRARIQFASLCWTLFLAGWSDGSMGPLLPRIQSVYHVLFLPQVSCA